MGSYNNMDMDSLIWTYGFIPPYPSCRASQVSQGEESICNAGDMGSILAQEDPLEKGNGNPLQYSCLGNPMDRGAWWATVQGLGKSQT